MELNRTSHSSLDLAAVGFPFREESIEDRLARIPPVTTQEEINSAFELNRVLQQCVREGQFDLISRIADSHTVPETHGWVFFQAICHICAQEEPQLERAINLTLPITDPIYLGSALGTIGERYFLLRETGQAFAWIDRINDQGLRESTLARSLNLLYNQHQYKTCCKIAAVLKDVKNSLRLGTSSIKEGLSELEDKETRKSLKQFYHSNKHLF